LKDGDRILIGTSIIKMVYVEGDSTSNAISETEARSKMAVAANKRSTPKSMAGSIEEIPLPDLLQLLSTSRKSGVLVVRTDTATGKLFLRKGQIYYATLDPGNAGSRKAVIRMLSWTQGSFELDAPDESPVPEEMDESTEALLMEGMRQLDEYNVQIEKLPPLSTSLSIPRPLTPKLRELTPEELDVFQAVMEGDTTISGLFDRSPLSDLMLAEKLRTLIEKGYVVTR
ncbi:MAG TPA: DUF4388 domain-containing protein, partial [Polyangia bacterium]|nr:DUF4388 domain-containing protein [Polyangia bacterium]